MVSPFEASLEYKGTDPMDFIVIVNPKNVSPKQGTIYQDLFPIVWQVLHFPAGGEKIPFSFEPTNTAMVTSVDDNIVTYTSSHQIGAYTFFDVTKCDSNIDSYDILPDPSKQSKKIATIVNKADKVVNVGIGDKNSRAYMTLHLKPGWESEFESIREFAVIPTSDYNLGQQFMSDNIAPWLWIDGNAITGTLTIQHDGTKFTVNNLDAKSWKLHDADVSPFA